MTEKRDPSGLDLFSFDDSPYEDEEFLEEEQFPSTGEEIDEEEENVEPTIEDMIALIDEISEQMEEGELTLKESFEKYKEGMELVRKCSKQIDQYEKQIRILDEKGQFDDY